MDLLNELNYELYVDCWRRREKKLKVEGVSRGLELRVTV